MGAGKTTPLLKTADMNQNESAKGDWAGVEVDSRRSPKEVESSVLRLACDQCDCSDSDSYQLFEQRSGVPSS